MSRDLIILCIVLVVNTLVALGYLLITLVRFGSIPKARIIRAVVMFLVPVMGPLYFVLGYCVFRLLFDDPVDLADVVFSKDKAKMVMLPDEERERNIVPIEEAIEITDTEDLRNLMMNVGRGDIDKTLASIALALNSSDSETSHYAASMLQEALGYFRDEVDRRIKEFEEEEDEEIKIRLAQYLLDYMNDVLVQQVFSSIEQSDFVHKMDHVGDVYYGLRAEALTSTEFENLALRLLEVEDADNCRKWADRCVYRYPNTLSTYTTQLKLYFNTGNRERFFEVIEDLKRSDVVVDSETLELIRVFR